MVIDGKVGLFFSVFATMWSKSDGKDIGALEKPSGMRWCNKHLLLDSKAKLEHDGTGGNVIQFVLKVNVNSLFTFQTIRGLTSKLSLPP